MPLSFAAGPRVSHPSWRIGPRPPSSVHINPFFAAPVMPALGHHLLPKCSPDAVAPGPAAHPRFSFLVSYRYQRMQRKGVHRRSNHCTYFGHCRPDIITALTQFSSLSANSAAPGHCFGSLANCSWYQWRKSFFTRNLHNNSNLAQSPSQSKDFNSSAHSW